VSGLPDKILGLHGALDEASIPHAFGGALALAWCTQRARGTIDIDLNIFVDLDRTQEVFDVLPPGVAWTDDDVATVTRDGQIRLWWDSTPVDLFLNTTDFHHQVATRCRQEQFAGAEVPFLSCSDLAVFKAFFNRTKDWADLEEMVSMGTLDLDRLIGVLVRYLGPDDLRVDRVRRLAVPG
jgi:hypothetical protein